MSLLRGLISAVYTPFYANGEVRFDEIPKYVDYLLARKMNGLYICGTTGEGVNMTVSERGQVARTFIDAAAGKVPTVVQVGANALADSQTLAAAAESDNASAISANAPSYFKITDMETLAQWCIEIASAAPKTPFYYYHIPSFTGVDIQMTSFLSIMEKRCPTFAGVKYTDVKGFVFQEAIGFGGGKYEILWGCDEMLLAGMALGAKGGVGSTYAMFPSLYHEILAAWNRNDWETARTLQRKSWEFIQVLLKYSPVHPSGKLVMRLHGIELGPCRLPFARLDESAGEKIAADLKRLDMDVTA